MSEKKPAPPAKKVYVAELGYNRHYAMDADSAARLLAILERAQRVGRVGYGGPFYPMDEEPHGFEPVKLTHMVNRPHAEAQAEWEAERAAERAAKEAAEPVSDA